MLRGIYNRLICVIVVIYEYCEFPSKNNIACIAPLGSVAWRKREEKLKRGYTLKMKKRLTIVTPSYNRAHTLPKVYRSLVKQSNQSFVWLIIDDGSKDRTEDLVNSFINEGRMEIRYVKKNNGGKASALNLALDIIGTEYCTCLDSDDWFSDDAVNRALQLLDEEKENNKCCGVLAIRNNPDGSVMGNVKIPKNYKYITPDNLYNDLRFASELICFYKTEIAKKYRFPIIPKEKFIPPSWFHYAICEQHCFRTSWDCLCFCEYAADGLTRNKRKIIVDNPKGYTLIKKISFEHSRRFKRKFKNGTMYVCGSILSKNKDWLKNAPSKSIALLVLPVAVSVYFIRFKRLKK